MIVHVWEQSVHATHEFLSDHEIKQLKSLILKELFDAVQQKCIKNTKRKIIGFSGVNEQHLEMLFVSPASQGKGVGTSLCVYAIKHQGVTKVDVNEKNPRAKVFYEKIGFHVVGRSELDRQNMPHPIIHMQKTSS